MEQPLSLVTRDNIDFNVCAFCLNRPFHARSMAIAAVQVARFFSTRCNLSCRMEDIVPDSTSSCSSMHPEYHWSSGWSVLDTSSLFVTFKYLTSDSQILFSINTKEQDGRVRLRCLFRYSVSLTSLPLMSTRKRILFSLLILQLDIYLLLQQLFYLIYFVFEKFK